MIELENYNNHCVFDRVKPFQYRRQWEEKKRTLDNDSPLMYARRLNQCEHNCNGYQTERIERIERKGNGSLGLFLLKDL